MAGMLSSLFSRSTKTSSPLKNGAHDIDKGGDEMGHQAEAGRDDDEMADGLSNTASSSEAGSAEVGVNGGAESGGEEGKQEQDEDEVAQSGSEFASEEEVHRAPRRRKGRSGRKAVPKGGSSADESQYDSQSTSSDSEAAEWDGESEEEAETKAKALDPNRCIFCGENESNDPGPQDEEYLNCVSCGDNAHRQCATDHHALLDIEDTEEWRCPGCVENDIEPEKPEIVAAARRRRPSSVPKIARDLLPPQKGVVKPGAHSVFNKLILDDDPMDGSRALRKRKPSDDSLENHTLVPSKRQKKSQSIDVVDNLFDRVLGPKDAHMTLLESDNEQPQSPKGRTRSRQRAKVVKPLVRVVEDSDEKLIIAFSFGTSTLTNLENERRKEKRRQRDRARRALKAQHEEEVPVLQHQHYPAIPATTFSAPFYSFNDRDMDETKTKPYGGILTETEADTSRTFPQPSDRKKFDDARQKAEDDWRARMEAAHAAEIQKSSHKTSGPPSKIKCISFGGYEIDTWNAAPYPEEYSRNRVLYICEFCLKYMNSDFVAWRHKLKCPAKHPPGDEIYRDGSFSFFEVDGRKNPVYCQNLCLLAKLFLGSKTLYYDVEPFLFYIMTENDDYGCHFVGYFSKEKRPSSLNNVSCILVLPIHQRRGFGQLLIDFSYLLTRNEKKTGSPEKPLSDMGLVSYRSYWRLTLCTQLLEQKDALSITDISDRTGMTADDIVCALEGLRALVRDPITKTYALRLDYPFFQQYIENHDKKEYTKINPDALIWTPYVMGRDTSLYDNGAGPQIHTMIQRDEDGHLELPEDGVQMDIKEAFETNHEGTLPTERLVEDHTPLILNGVNPSPLNGLQSPSPTTPVPIAPMLARSTTNTSQSKPSFSQTSVSSTSPEKSQQTSTTIPPTRFEVFPPLPGTAARRKPGRPFGRRGSRGRGGGIPVRRSLFRGSPQSASVGRSGALKRTRSRLGDVESVRDEEEDEDDDGNGGVEGEGEAGGNGEDEEVNGQRESVDDDGEEDKFVLAPEDEDDEDDT